MAFCSVLFFAQNTFPAGHCLIVLLTVRVPAQWLWLISQLGSLSQKRECFSLFSALLFCSWLEQAAVPGVILGPLPITVSDVNTFLNVWLLALSPNRFIKNLHILYCNLFSKCSLSLDSILLDGVSDWIFCNLNQQTMQIITCWPEVMLTAAWKIRQCAPSPYSIGRHGWRFERKSSFPLQMKGASGCRELGEMYMLLLVLAQVQDTAFVERLQILPWE